jgi:putative hydrolase of the HAD superfamily
VLKERGLKLGVVSNTYQRGAVLGDQLTEAGAARYIDVAVFSSEMGLRKPHPSLFEMPLAELGVAPEEAVFVGDSPEADIQGAQAVGMRAVLTRQYRQESVEGVTPDCIIWRLPELIEYIDSLNSH